MGSALTIVMVAMMALMAGGIAWGAIAGLRTRLRDRRNHSETVGRAHRHRLRESRHGRRFT